MAGRWRLIGLGLIVAGIAAVVGVYLTKTASEPERQGTAPLATASPAPAPVPAPSPRAGQIPAVAVEKTTVTTVDAQGRRQWELRADEVVVDGTSNTAVLTRVQGTYYQRGQPEIGFSAARGTFNIQTRVVVLSGSVRARATSGRAVEADNVEWIPKSQQVIATGAVVLRQKGLTLRADRLTADTSLKHANLVGNIRVVVEE
ncbi:MAG TPA: LPS export ABC transporter periplasmic protein LptC [bacterium]|nr:LPS export ABC transporter periplasmic protein LptC [bacterium]